MSDSVNDYFGGFWYRDHCITITPNKKLDQKIRYRYPNEEWIEVEGDDYELIDMRQGQCEDTSYRITFTFFVAGQTGGCLTSNGGCQVYTRSSSFTGRFAGLEYFVKEPPFFLE